MARKTFILDTNVFLHDPQALHKFKNNDIVIPLDVLEELGNMKRENTERGNNARAVMRFIDSLKAHYKGDFVKGIILPKGPKIRIFLDDKKQRVAGFPLPLDRVSNRILSISYLLKRKKEKVIFVSKDFISRVKAEAMGIESEDYENTKVSYQELLKGVKKIQVPKSDIDHFYKDGQLDIMRKDFYPNEYCILTSEERSSAICRYDYKTQKLKPIIHVEKGIWGLLPLNVEQRCSFDLLLRDDIPLVTLIGPAGTGKTLLTLACGMKKAFDENTHSKILVSRPIIPLGRDIGYLPGTKEEKLYHWMQPIHDNLELLCQLTSGKDNGKAALQYIMESGKIETEAVTYIRGRTLPKMYMIIDEAQNLTPHEVKTIISRAGKGTKVVLTGDPTQIDNPYLDKDSNGLSYVLSKFKGQKLYGHVYLDKTERSELASIAAEIL